MDVMVAKGCSTGVVNIEALSIDSHTIPAKEGQPL
jgi:hypothetical protein